MKHEEVQSSGPSQGKKCFKDSDEQPTWDQAKNVTQKSPSERCTYSQLYHLYYKKASTKQATCSKEMKLVLASMYISRKIQPYFSAVESSHSFFMIFFFKFLF